MRASDRIEEIDVPIETWVAAVRSLADLLVAQQRDDSVLPADILLLERAFWFVKGRLEDIEGTDYFSRDHTEYFAKMQAAVDRGENPWHVDWVDSDV